jgi:hypothetical protein
MAKPRVFISSTFYDLKQIRADLDNFIQSLGYDVVRNEEGAIPYGTNFKLEDYCYKEINSVDILVAIIGGRFGSESDVNNKYSISNQEIKTAIEHNKQVYIFIEKDVDSEYYTYLKNKENKIVYSHAVDVRIYKFLEEIRALKRNNVIHPFSSSGDIISFLKEQWAGLFQHYLQEQSNMAESNMLRQLNESLATVRDLTDYLVSANENQSNNLKGILINNHPVFNELCRVMKWDFPIIFHSIKDLTNLLRPWSCISANSDKQDYLKFSNDKYEYSIYVLKALFDCDGKLQPLNVTSELPMIQKVKIENDLPF